MLGEVIWIKPTTLVMRVGKIIIWIKSLPDTGVTKNTEYSKVKLMMLGEVIWINQHFTWYRNGSQHPRSPQEKTSPWHKNTHHHRSRGAGYGM